MAFLRTGVSKSVVNPKVYMQQHTTRKKYTTVDFNLAKGKYVMYLYAYGNNGQNPYVNSYDNITALSGATTTKLSANRYELNVPSDGSISMTFESGVSDSTSGGTEYVIIVF